MGCRAAYSVDCVTNIKENVMENLEVRMWIFCHKSDRRFYRYGVFARTAAEAQEIFNSKYSKQTQEEYQLNYDIGLGDTITLKNE